MSLKTLITASLALALAFVLSMEVTSLAASSLAASSPAISHFK